MLRTAMISLCCMLCSSIASAQANLSISEYRDAVLLAIVKAHPDWKISPLGEDTIEYYKTLEPSEDSQPALYFANYGHRQYLLDPSGLKDHIEQIIATLELERPALDEYKDRLVMLLRPDIYLEPFGADQPPVLSLPYGGDLVAIFFLDSPDTLSAVSKSEIEPLNLSLEAAEQIAKSNLANRIGTIDVETIEGLELLTTETGLAAGIPLINETCTEGIPNNAWWLVDRNTLLQTEFEGGPSEGDPLLELIMAIVADAVFSHEAYSDFLFLCVEGEQLLMKPSPAAPE